nr:SH3 domain-containing protein [Clostridium tagluense]
MCNELETLGLKNRGAKIDERGLNEVRKTSMTSCIVEPILCDYNIDMKLYSADKIARSIVKGITGKSVNHNEPVTNTIEVWKNVTAMTLNVRSGQGTGFSEIGELHKGDNVKIDKSYSNGWTSVFFGNNGGYVSTQYLK